MGNPYGFASCGCPNSHMGTHHVKGCTGTRASTFTPERPKPPPIGPGSRVRLASVFKAEGRLSSFDVFTVERVEARGGKKFVFLVGDARPWRLDRFVAAD
jgi:hypothetical protein